VRPPVPKEKEERSKERRKHAKNASSLQGSPDRILGQLAIGKIRLGQAERNPGPERTVNTKCHDRNAGNQR
jgi:hypothetical protein